MKRFLLTTLLVSGCGQDPEKELVCDRSDRDGTYLVQHFEQDGTCGPIADQLGRLDSDQPTPDGCEVEHERWSENDCKVERSLTCVFEDDDQQMELIAVSEQEDEDGDRITGIATMTVREASSGNLICSSTYRLAASRQ